MIYIFIIKMPRLTLDESASAVLSLEKGVEYRVLKINDNKVIEDLQVQEIAQELSGYVRTNPQVHIGVDLGGVDFISSTFIGKLMATDKKLKDSSRNPLYIKNVRPEIYEVFAITRLEHLFEMDKASRAEYNAHISRSQREFSKLRTLKAIRRGEYTPSNNWIILNFSTPENINTWMY